MDEMKRMLEVIIGKLGTVENRLGTLEQGQAETNQRLDKLENRMDGLETRMGGLETRMGTMEIRMGGLETDVKEVKQTVERVEGRIDNLAIQLGHFADNEARDIESVRLEMRMEFGKAQSERAKYALMAQQAFDMASYSAAFARNEELRRQAK